MKARGPWHCAVFKSSPGSLILVHFSADNFSQCLNNSNLDLHRLMKKSMFMKPLWIGRIGISTTERANFLSFSRIYGCSLFQCHTFEALFVKMYVFGITVSVFLVHASLLSCYMLVFPFVDAVSPLVRAASTFSESSDLADKFWSEIFVSGVSVAVLAAFRLYGYRIMIRSVS